MRILGVETSCDDTALGLITNSKGKIVIEGQVTASQALIHRKYGGVVPEVAAREHALTIVPTLKALFKQTRRDWRDIDVIAVTGGPGLSTALNVGVEFARTAAMTLNKKLVRVNHIEGHIASAWAETKNIRFPAVALVVSGGHTELILMKKFGQYSLLGHTIDDAVGEAFDKTAKILSRPYPGGPQISKLAISGDPTTFKFPRSMLGPDTLDFSYAGLKTAVLYETLRHTSLSKKQRADIAASFQVAAIEPLVEKSRRALKKTGAKSLLLVGGVAANPMLRKSLQTMISERFPKTIFVRAPLSLCMDNGVMIALAGAWHAQRRQFDDWSNVTANPNWELV